MSSKPIDRRCLADGHAWSKWERVTETSEARTCSRGCQVAEARRARGAPKLKRRIAPPAE